MHEKKNYQTSSRQRKSRASSFSKQSCGADFKQIPQYLTNEHVKETSTHTEAHHRGARNGKPDICCCN